MKISEVVKNRLLINFGLASLFSASAVLGAPSELKGPLYQLECGTYTMKGNLSQDKQGRFVLTLNKGSSSPFEVILLGGSIREKSVRLAGESVVRVYVPQPIQTQERPFVFFQTFVREQKPSDRAVILEKKESCGKQDRFLGSN